MTGAQFRAARLALGLSSQDAAARFLGVSLRTAHNYENDSRPIPTATAKLLRLMERLDLKPKDVRFRDRARDIAPARGAPRRARPRHSRRAQAAR